MQNWIYFFVIFEIVKKKKKNNVFVPMKMLKNVYDLVVVRLSEYSPKIEIYFLKRIAFFPILVFFRDFSLKEI